MYAILNSIAVNGKKWFSIQIHQACMLVSKAELQMSTGHALKIYKYRSIRLANTLMIRKYKFASSTKQNRQT